MTLLASGFGMFMIFTRNFQSILIFACILVLLMFAFRVLGVVRLREVLSNIKEKNAITGVIQKEERAFEKARLHFCRAETFGQWWDSVCVAAENMDFSKVVLPTARRDGGIQIFSWSTQDSVFDRKNLIKMTIPVEDRRSDSTLNLEVDIDSAGSLESAGRRARLFNRLMEEYSVASLANKNSEKIALQV